MPEGGYHPPWTWDLGHNGIRSTSGWYASCWNAFLFGIYFTKNYMEMKESGLGGGVPI